MTEANDLGAMQAEGGRIHSGGMGSIADLRRADHIPSSVHSFRMHVERKARNLWLVAARGDCIGEGGKDTHGECSMSVAGAFSAVEKGRSLNLIYKMYGDQYQLWDGRRKH